MSIRSDACAWFQSKYGETKNRIYSSKYYLPEESWPKKHVWWPQIPVSAIQTNKYNYVNILCQIAPGKNEFYYLKVPTRFINENLEKFHKVGEKISLYLSAEPETMFVEFRGIGTIDFSKFLVQ